jgi:hypothetical protein
MCYFTRTLDVLHAAQNWTDWWKRSPAGQRRGHYFLSSLGGVLQPPGDLLFRTFITPPRAFQRLFPAPDASPGTHPTPPLFPTRIWCIFLPARLLQTLLFGPSITFAGDSGHGGASQSGLQYSVRQVSG